MTDRMVSSCDPPRAERVEVITSVQRRRHWTTQEKVRLVEETYLPGQSVSLVARRHGLNANQLFTWRRLAARNTRWCSDGFEIAAENGERVRVAFALDCCAREAMSYVATTAGITGEAVRDLMVAAVEHRFGAVSQLPSLLEWLTDNGSCYVARDTRRFTRDLGLVPKTTPLESPQSNGMAEAFVRTLKRDYVRIAVLPDAESVLRQLPVWLAHYNDLHPHRALGYRSPREFIARSTWETPSGL